MRERATQLDGRFSVHTAPGHGTRISADLPLSPRTDNLLNATTMEVLPG
jgi:chemotaxis protein histidine kinase CheA